MIDAYVYLRPVIDTEGRKMTPRLACAQVVLVLAATLALAPPAQARGTHYLLEVGGGGGVTDLQAAGAFWDVSLGYGGKFRGFPIRFYFMLNYSGVAIAAEGNGFARQTEDQALLGGPRLYIPLARNMRLYGQALFGAYWARSDWTVHGIESYHPRDEGLAGKFTVGFQARVAPILSVGIFYDRMLFWDKANDLAVAAFTGLAGAADSGDQNRFGATLGIHF